MGVAIEIVNSVLALGITTTIQRAAENSVLTHHGVVQQGRLLPAPHNCSYCKEQIVRVWEVLLFLQYCPHTRLVFQIVRCSFAVHCL